MSLVSVRIVSFKSRQVFLNKKEKTHVSIQFKKDKHIEIHSSDDCHVSSPTFLLLLLSIFL
jgi:hypothetical protein